VFSAKQWSWASNDRIERCFSCPPRSPAQANSNGEKISDILVQRPQLTLRVLRLDTFEFHPLAPGASPSGAYDVARATSPAFEGLLIDPTDDRVD
jgi:hypothetical protein